jgi:hypothetical protein
MTIESKCLASFTKERWDIPVGSCKETTVYKYLIWARINPTQTVHTFVWADNDLAAKMIAEAQFGVGNVLSYSQVTD